MTLPAEAIIKLQYARINDEDHRYCTSVCRRCGAQPPQSSPQRSQVLGQGGSRGRDDQSARSGHPGAEPLLVGAVALLHRRSGAVSCTPSTRRLLDGVVVSRVALRTQVRRRRPNSAVSTRRNARPRRACPSGSSSPALPSTICRRSSASRTTPPAPARSRTSCSRSPKRALGASG